jgi:hypothetical protein
VRDAFKAIVSREKTIGKGSQVTYPHIRVE